MAQEYYQIKYDDREGVEIEIRIIDVSESPGADVIIAAYGKAVIEFDDVDDPFTILRPSTCTIELEADTTNTYSDLFTDNEREHKVEVYRGGTLQWQGWLSPEGIFEDFVNESWVITLTANDGISDLENKAYVDGSGGFYEGKVKLREVVLRCLNRTGLLDQGLFMQTTNIIVGYPVKYVDSPVLDVGYFNQTVNQRAFLSDDGKTPKSCAEVLEAVLLGANAYLHAWGGYFYISWNYQHSINARAGDYHWSTWTLGASSPGSPQNRDTSVTIGSEINGFTPHWANANQSIERRPALGAARIKYEFREVETLLDNSELDNNGSTITGWTESLDAASNDVVTLNTNGTVTIDNGSQTSAVFTSDPATGILSGTTIKLIIKFNVPLNSGSSFTITKFRMRVFLDGTTNYYLKDDMSWTTTATNIIFEQRRSGDYQIEYESEILPVTGDITFSIFPIDNNSGDASYTDSVTFDYISITNSNTNPPDGVDYESGRSTANLSYTAPSVEVSVGDIQGVIYLGTYFKSNGTDTTEGGYKSTTVTNEDNLYNVVLYDRMMMRGKTLRVFSGDVYGFFRYDSRVAIDGFASTFWAATGWRWDTKENIISVNLWEVYSGAAVLSDINIDQIINYGNAIEPTIKS